MQPLNRVLLVLLLVGTGIFFWIRQQSRGEYERQVGALAATLDRRYLSPTTPAAQAEAMFLRSLVILSDYRSLADRGRVRTGEETYLKETLAAAGYSSEAEIALVSKSLRHNLTLCQQMNIVSDPEGTQALLTGQAPVIRAGSFKGDSLVLGRRLSAVLAPELANHPANYALLPASAAALIWPFTLSDATLAAASEFTAQNLLDPKTALDLKQRAEQLKAINP